MTSPRSLISVRAALCLVALLVATGVQATRAADAPSADNAYLDGLQGEWYVVHWLDRFGAAGARVVASGKRTGKTLVILFPYAEGAFRNTYEFDPKSRSWSLIIESQAAGGGWSNFATYTLVHSKT